MLRLWLEEIDPGISVNLNNHGAEINRLLEIFF